MARSRKTESAASAKKPSSSAGVRKTRQPAKSSGMAQRVTRSQSRQASSEAESRPVTPAPQPAILESIEEDAAVSPNSENKEWEGLRKELADNDALVEKLQATIFEQQQALEEQRRAAAEQDSAVLKIAHELEEEKLKTSKLRSSGRQHILSSRSAWEEVHRAKGLVVALDKVLEQRDQRIKELEGQVKALTPEEPVEQPVTEAQLAELERLRSGKPESSKGTSEEVTKGSSTEVTTTTTPPPSPTAQAQSRGFFTSTVKRFNSFLPSPFRRAPQTEPIKRSTVPDVTPAAQHISSAEQQTPESPSARRSSGQALQLGIQEDVIIGEDDAMDSSEDATPSYELPEDSLAPPTPASANTASRRKPMYIYRERRRRRLEAAEKKRQEEELEAQMANRPESEAGAFTRESECQSSESMVVDPLPGDKRKRTPTGKGAYTIYYNDPDYQSSSEEETSDHEDGASDRRGSGPFGHPIKRRKTSDSISGYTDAELMALTSTPSHQPKHHPFSTPQPEHHKRPHASIFQAQTEPRRKPSFCDNDYDPNPHTVELERRHALEGHGHYSAFTGQWIPHGLSEAELPEETVETLDIHRYGLNRFRFATGFTNGYSYYDPHIRHLIVQGRKEGKYVRDGEHPLSHHPDDQMGRFGYTDREQLLQINAQNMKKQEKEDAARKAQEDAAELAREVAASNADFAAAAASHMPTAATPTPSRAFTTPATISTNSTDSPFSSPFGTPIPTTRTTGAVELTPSHLSASSGAPTSGNATNIVEEKPSQTLASSGAPMFGQATSSAANTSLTSPSKSNTNTDAVENSPSGAISGGAPGTESTIEPLTPGANRNNDPNATALDRARDQAEKYKPKTPSRLREASRLSASPASALQQQSIAGDAAQFLGHVLEDTTPFDPASFDEYAVPFDWDDPNNTEMPPTDHYETDEEWEARHKRIQERSAASIAEGNLEAGIAVLRGSVRQNPDVLEALGYPQPLLANPQQSFEWDEDPDFFAMQVKDKSVFQPSERARLEAKEAATV